MDLLELSTQASMRLNLSSNAKRNLSYNKQLLTNWTRPEVYVHPCWSLSLIYYLLALVHCLFVRLCFVKPGKNKTCYRRLAPASKWP